MMFTAFFCKSVEEFDPNQEELDTLVRTLGFLRSEREQSAKLRTIISPEEELETDYEYPPDNIINLDSRIATRQRIKTDTAEAGHNKIINDDILKKITSGQPLDFGQVIFQQENESVEGQVARTTARDSANKEHITKLLDSIRAKKEEGKNNE